MYLLREPQQIVFDKIRQNLSKGNKRILVAAATGFGKTALSYIIIKNALEKNNTVVFTSHRITLAEQTRDKFKGLQTDFLQGNNKDFKQDYKCLITTLQTLIQTEIKAPKIIIIDEVHYGYNSKLIQNLFKRFPEAIVIGLSATPVDDNDCILDGFDCIIDDYQTIDLIQLGWLVPTKCFAPFNIQISEDENVTDDINRSIVNQYVELGENRKFICFASSKKHCEQLLKMFLTYDIPVAIITADTKKSERYEYLSDFKNSRLKGLISIEILTAGFDEPSLNCVILATKMSAWKKYIQCCGRGLRLFGNSLQESIDNGKSDCIILDFCGNIEKHNLPEVRKDFKAKLKFSKAIDKHLGLDVYDKETEKKYESITIEKSIFLKKISNILDLYDGRIYRLESELQEDVNSFLKKTGYFWWRQNSGKVLINGRWVHFASKSGLPDCTVFYKNSSMFFGLELKLPKGTFTKHQKETLPEMEQKKVLYFVCQSVFDVFRSICHIEKNFIDRDNFYLVKKEIYNYPEWQLKLRKNNP
jgi:superfamily II DNA or RNA helicase